MELDQVLFSVGEYSITFGRVAVALLWLLLSILVVRLLVKFLERRLRANKVQADVIHLVRRLVYVLAFLVILFTVLDLINVPIAAFAFLSGAVAIGVGFGAQNIINNFISGWILMWERPIRIGDFLEAEGHLGTVESINVRSTLIHRVDGVYMLVPNSKLLENTVVNWTIVDRLMRSQIRVGVAYGSPVKRVAELLLQATREHEATRDDPEIKVIFEDFGDNALIFDIFVWVDMVAGTDLRVVRSDIRFRICELFEENDIVIAFPQRDVHLDGTLTLSNPVSEFAAGESVPAKQS